MDTPNAPLIIIGAGPAGLYAAVQLGMKGHRSTIIDALPYPGGQCAALYPAGMINDAPSHHDISAASLVDQLKDQLQPFAPLLLTSRRAKSVWGSLNAGFSVETNTGETITGAAVIYAGGAGALIPRPLMTSGIEAVKGGVSYLTEGAQTSAGKRVAVFGDGKAAIDLALTVSRQAKSVALIHSTPLRAGQRTMNDLASAAAARRLSVVNGDLSRVHSADGLLSRIEISVNGAAQMHDVDLLLVQAGLERARETITGLTDINNAMTGETETPGIFIIGDALPSASRPPVIAAGFSEASRAVEAIQQRFNADELTTPPHTTTSPDEQAHRNVA